MRSVLVLFRCLFLLKASSQARTEFLDISGVIDQLYVKQRDLKGNLSIWGSEDERLHDVDQLTASHENETVNGD